MQITNRLLRRKQILSKTGLSASTIYNLEKSGDFPNHILITPRCAAWYESDVDFWISSRRESPAPLASHPDVKLRIAKNALKNNVNK